MKKVFSIVLPVNTDKLAPLFSHILEPCIFATDPYIPHSVNKALNRPRE